MTEPRNDRPSDRGLTIRWKGDDFAKLEAAAKAFGEREHMETSPTDIIRSGALRFASEILAAQQTEAA